MRALKLVGMVRLVGTIGLLATVATAAFAGPGAGSVRQVTGKVTVVTAKSITVKSPNATLRCASRPALKLNRFAGKRVTMGCRMVAGRLVVKSVRLLAPGKALQKKQQQAPAPQGPSPADDDPADGSREVVGPRDPPTMQARRRSSAGRALHS